MAEIKEFQRRLTEDEILDMNDEAFNELLSKYENHPKLKSLITEYRNLSSEADVHCNQMSLKVDNLSGDLSRFKGDALNALAYGYAVGVLKARIANTLINL